MFKIVFIDDEAITLRLLTAVLDWESYGIEIAGCAEDGYAGLELCRRVKPDIVIMDIRMPKMSGVDLSEMIRKTNQTVKLIFLSAYAEFEYAQSAITNKVSGYLLKPVDEEKLEELIRKVVSEIESERQIRSQSESYLNSQSIRSIRLGYQAYLKAGIEETGTGYAGKRRASSKKAGTDMAEEGFTAGEGNFTGSEWSEFLPGFSGVMCIRFFCPADREELHLPESSVTEALDRSFPAEYICIYMNSYESFLLIRESVRPEQVSAALAAAGLMHRAGAAAFSKEGLYVSMQNAGKAADRSLYEKNTVIYDFHEMKKGVLSEVSFFAWQAAVLELTELGDASALIRRIEKLIDDALAGTADPEELYAALQDIFIWIRHAVVQNYSESELSKKVLRHADVLRLRACLTEDALKTYIRQELISAAEEIRRKIDETDSSSVVRRAKAYVEKHYGEQTFSLQGAADNVGMSKNHFSRVFHMETGMKFWDYVTEVRIRHARQLLTDPMLSIAEISSRVGYETESHFNRKFKEIQGITPGRYRREY